jgi:hypothetical protein
MLADEALQPRIRLDAADVFHAVDEDKGVRLSATVEV